MHLVVRWIEHIAAAYAFGLVGGEVLHRLNERGNNSGDSHFSPGHRSRGFGQ